LHKPAEWQVNKPGQTMIPCPLNEQELHWLGFLEKAELPSLSSASVPFENLCILNRRQINRIIIIIINQGTIPKKSTMQLC